MSGFGFGDRPDPLHDLYQTVISFSNGETEAVNASAEIIDGAAECLAAHLQLAAQASDCCLFLEACKHTESSNVAVDRFHCS